MTNFGHYKDQLFEKVKEYKIFSILKNVCIDKRTNKIKEYNPLETMKVDTPILVRANNYSTCMEVYRTV